MAADLWIATNLHAYKGGVPEAEQEMMTELVKAGCVYFRTSLALYDHKGISLPECVFVEGWKTEPTMLPPFSAERLALPRAITELTTYQFPPAC